jgi:hypothetical protein
VELPDVAGIERLSLHPGDRLVLSLDCQLNDAEFASLKEYVRGWGLPEGSVIIIDGGVHLQVLEAAWPACPVCGGRHDPEWAGHGCGPQRIV